MRHRLSGLLALALALALFAVASLASTPQAAAVQRTAVFQLDLTVPVRGIRVVGTFTMTWDDVNGDGRWEFTGDVTGEQAAAAGTLMVSAGSDGEVALAIVGIDRWDVASSPPALPATLTIREAAGTALIGYDGPTVDVFAIPFTMTPALAVPLDGAWMLTDAGSVPTGGGELPATGGPADPSQLRANELGMALLGTGVLLVATGMIALLVRSQRRAGGHG